MVGRWSVRRHTAILRKIESQQNANDTADDQEQAKEVEIRDVFFECTALVRVEVEEKEQDGGSKSASRKIEEEDPVENKSSVTEATGEHMCVPSPSNMVCEQLRRNC
jgi:hypothetical protein